MDTWSILRENEWMLFFVKDVQNLVVVATNWECLASRVNWRCAGERLHIQLTVECLFACVRQRERVFTDK